MKQEELKEDWVKVEIKLNKILIKLICKILLQVFSNLINLDYWEIKIKIHTFHSLDNDGLPDWLHYTNIKLNAH